MKEVKVLSHSVSVQLFVIPWTVARKPPPSMEFSGQEYWSGQPFLSPGDLFNTGIKPMSPASRAVSLVSLIYTSMYLFLCLTNID